MESVKRRDGAFDDIDEGQITEEEDKCNAMNLSSIGPYSPEVEDISSDSDDSVILLPSPSRAEPLVVTISDEEEDVDSDATDKIADDLEILELRRKVLEATLTRENVRDEAEPSVPLQADNYVETVMEVSPSDGEQLLLEEIDLPLDTPPEPVPMETDLVHSDEVVKDHVIIETDVIKQPDVSLQSGESETTFEPQIVTSSANTDPALYHSNNRAKTSAYPRRPPSAPSIRLSKDLRPPSPPKKVSNSISFRLSPPKVTEPLYTRTTAQPQTVRLVGDIAPIAEFRDYEMNRRRKSRADIRSSERHHESRNSRKRKSSKIVLERTRSHSRSVSPAANRRCSKPNSRRFDTRTALPKIPASSNKHFRRDPRPRLRSRSGSFENSTANDDSFNSKCHSASGDLSTFSVDRTPGYISPPAFVQNIVIKRTNNRSTDYAQPVVPSIPTQTPTVTLVHPRARTNSEDEDQLRAKLLIELSKTRLAAERESYKDEAGNIVVKISQPTTQIKRVNQPLREPIVTRNVGGSVYKWERHKTATTSNTKTSVPTRSPANGFSFIKRTIYNPFAFQSKRPLQQDLRQMRYTVPNVPNKSISTTSRIRPIIINVRGETSSDESDAPVPSSRTVRFVRNDADSGSHSQPSHAISDKRILTKKSSTSSRNVQQRSPSKIPDNPRRAGIPAIMSSNIESFIEKAREAAVANLKKLEDLTSKREQSDLHTKVQDTNTGQQYGYTTDDKKTKDFNQVQLPEVDLHVVTKSCLIETSIGVESNMESTPAVCREDSVQNATRRIDVEVGEKIKLNSEHSKTALLEVGSEITKNVLSEVGSEITKTALSEVEVGSQITKTALSEVDSNIAKKLLEVGDFKSKCKEQNQQIKTETTTETFASCFTIADRKDLNNELQRDGNQLCGSHARGSVQDDPDKVVDRNSAQLIPVIEDASIEMDMEHQMEQIFGESIVEMNIVEHCTDDVKASLAAFHPSKEINIEMEHERVVSQTPADLDSSVTNPPNPNVLNKEPSHSEVIITRVLVESKAESDEAEAKLMDHQLETDKDVEKSCADTSQPVNVGLKINEDQEINMSPGEVNDGTVRCAEVPKTKQSEQLLGDEPLHNASSTISLIFPSFEGTVQEKEHKELLLRERLLRAAIRRRVESSELQLSLRNAESQLIGKRLQCLSKVDGLNEKLNRLSTAKLQQAKLEETRLYYLRQLADVEKEIDGNVKKIDKLDTIVRARTSSLLVDQAQYVTMTESCIEYGGKLSGIRYLLPNSNLAEYDRKYTEARKAMEKLKMSITLPENPKVPVPPASAPVGSTPRLKERVLKPNQRLCQTGITNHSYVETDDENSDSGEDTDEKSSRKMGNERIRMPALGFRDFLKPVAEPPPILKAYEPYVSIVPHETMLGLGIKQKITHGIGLERKRKYRRVTRKATNPNDDSASGGFNESTIISGENEQS